MHITLICSWMSALGRKQTYAVQKGMSALPPIATLIASFGMSALQLRLSDAATRQDPQICFGIVATGGHSADLVWFFECSLHPDFVWPRGGLKPRTLHVAEFAL